MSSAWGRNKPLRLKRGREERKEKEEKKRYENSRNEEKRGKNEAKCSFNSFSL